MSTDIELANVDQARVLATLNINVDDPKSQAVILVAKRYELDPLLKHIMVIQGTPYITKAGYLHIAHRSGVFDGIEILDEKETEKQCSARVAVYRKDMNRPFVTSARFNKSDAKGRDPMDMALARATRRGLQQAFDVADVFGNADEVDDADLQHVGSMPSAGQTQVETVSEARALGGSIPPSSGPAETLIDLKYELAEADDPFETAEPLPPSELVSQITQAFEGSEEMADAATRKELLALIGELDEEQRSALLSAWRASNLGGLKDNVADQLLVRDVEKARRLVVEQAAKATAAYDRRRKHVNSMLKEAGITSDEGRHEFIAQATGGETNSSKALLGRHVKAIQTALDELEAGETEEVPLDFGESE